ncbi:tol-pal system protein YbgF [Falsihalocynthiibacter sp. S25ZX9]|uniref:tol-pal system protein YbgF n=1 Tax=Falsihalocynthiibacter sp. S25ZX9 TaxID=3240870 RepID=UPI00350EDF7A
MRYQIGFSTSRRALTGIVAASFLSFGMGGVAAAQDQTLADIRQELSVVYVEIQKLKRELSTTGGANGGQNNGSLIERIETLEAQLQSVTARSEEIELRLDRVVTDGTNRIGDLEFRICELEPKCDIGSLTLGSTLGGDTSAVNTAQAPTDSVQLAVGEEADFAAAKAAMDAGNFTDSVEKFDAFTTNYPGSRLSQEAHFLRGTSYESLSETSSAARAFLASFSGDPNGAFAPKALLKLGVSLGALGQTNEACLMLGEVETRFPSSEIIGQAQSSMSGLGCS